MVRSISMVRFQNELKHFGLKNSCCCCKSSNFLERPRKITATNYNSFLFSIQVAQLLRLWKIKATFFLQVFECMVFPSVLLQAAIEYPYLFPTSFVLQPKYSTMNPEDLTDEASCDFGRGKALGAFRLPKLGLTLIAFRLPLVVLRL